MNYQIFDGHKSIGKTAPVRIHAIELHEFSQCIAAEL